MRDGHGRRAVKWVARTIFLAELTLRRALRRRRGETRYALGGTCTTCAKCCESPSIQVDRVTWYLPSMRRLFLAWQRHVNGFAFVSAERQGRIFVFRCEHFDLATRRCDSYDSRPGMCRDYPRGLLDQPWPEFLPGCTYRAIDTKGSGLLVALGRAGLTADKEAELRRKLHLE
jgi:uncharacterized cysteine cluster protein YcgN (CxxCxxCC family)